MSFLRPEAVALLRRWREVALCLVLIAWGVWIARQPGGMILQGFGLVLCALGAFGLLPAIQRARFTARGDGPGVVTVDEGQILFMGPHKGGAIALADLAVLSVRRNAHGGTDWVLASRDQILVIPVNALGADGLFDAFAALPGLRMEKLVRAVQSRTKGSERIWRREGPEDRGGAADLTPPAPQVTSADTNAP